VGGVATAIVQGYPRRRLGRLEAAARGFEPARPALTRSPKIDLRALLACFTVTPAMISMATITSTLFHGGTPAERVKCWPQAELAQRTSDAASGV